MSTGSLRASYSPGHRREVFLACCRHKSNGTGSTGHHMPFSEPPWYSAVLPALRERPCYGQDPSHRLCWLLHTPPTEFLCCPWDTRLLFQLPFPTGPDPGPSTTCLTNSKCPNEPRLSSLRELLTALFPEPSCPAVLSIPPTHNTHKTFSVHPLSHSQGLWWPLSPFGCVCG